MFEGNLNREDYLNKIINANVMEGIKQLPDKCVNSVITSPPYFGLRDYGVSGQLGLEKTPEEYVFNMVQLFTDIKRVLKDDGTLWLNLGDSYASGGRNRTPDQAEKNSTLLGGRNTQRQSLYQPNKITEGLKAKDLIGIPWMVAFALRASGWYLRQDIIWHKPNPMPESVTDRCTKSHEYIFLLSKSAKYYFDHSAIKQPLAKATHVRLAQDIANQTGSNRVPGKTNGTMKAVGPASWNGSSFDKGKTGEMKHTRGGINKGLTFGGKKGREYTPDKDDPNYRNGSEQWGREYTPSPDGKANKRSVWTVTTKPFKEAHFATFPEDLITDCVKAGCPKGGIVLDPFMGAGTTALVALKLGRNFTGFELNPDYIRIAEKRLDAFYEDI
jgi:DNA modification methylase